MDLITAKEITKIWKMDKIKIPKTIFIIHQKKLFDSINEKLNLKKINLLGEKCILMKKMNLE